MNQTPDDSMRSDDAQVDAMLRRAYTPPSSAALAHLVPAPLRLRTWPRVMALVGAVAAILLVALLWGARQRERDTPDPRALPAMWVAAYHDAVTRGFDTANCCDGDSDLRARCKSLFATALDLDADADVEMCGAYCGLPAGGAAAMLARAGDEPVCVFVLPRVRAAHVPAGDIDGLRIHRREFGDLVVFEVSRLRDPRVLPHLYVPEG